MSEPARAPLAVPSMGVDASADGDSLGAAPGNLLSAAPGISLGAELLAVARAHAQRPALRIGPRTWCYGELAARAEAWGAAILTAVPTARRVGVLAYRSEVAYTAILAATVSGLTFVPLNPTFPAARTARMAAAADLDVIIADPASLPLLETLLRGLPRMPCVVLPEATAPPALHGARVLVASDLPPRDAGPTPRPAERPLYLLFTSGSTGQPKGVPILESNVRHFLAVNRARYALTCADRLTQTFDITFDLAMFDIFMAWLHGACLCVPAPLQLLSPYAFAREMGITVWFSVPSVINLLRRAGSLTPDSLPSLRWSLFCGEPLTLDAARAWAAAAPHSQLENLYGPTELTIACAVHRYDAESTPAACVNGLVPLGTLYPGMTGVVLDEGGRRIAPGEAGELCVTGPQQFPGYLDDAARTASAHWALRDADGSVQRYYRTGDRVAARQGHPIVFLGRTDHQLKVMGYRVELGDIEAALGQAPGVLDAVAMGWPTSTQACTGIVAFVIGTDVSPTAVIAHAKARLPRYMVPQRVLVRSAWPLNGNGKVDRRALEHILTREV